MIAVFRTRIFLAVLSVLVTVTYAEKIDHGRRLLQSFDWTQVGTDIDGDGDGVRSGYSVSISSDGTRVAIGAPYTDDRRGIVRVYAESDGTWTQAGDGIDCKNDDARFGYSVSISSDGTRVAIGAPSHDEDSVRRDGHVRVYAESSGTWTQVGADIVGEHAGDRSGSSVSISSDGKRVAIGADRNLAAGHDWNLPAGHTRVFAESGGTWTQVGADIDGEAAGDESGTSVSISSDGMRVAIGAIMNSDKAGHVRVYAESGGTWTQVGADIVGEAAGVESGTSVSISSDGKRVAIGAPYADDAGNNRCGQVRVYAESGNTWIQVGTDIDGEDEEESSGFSVSISSDGTRVAIGAPSHDGNAGHVRVYSESGGTWTQVAAGIDGEDGGDASGVSVSMSSDGTRVAIGAPSNDGAGNAAGHARVFVESNAVSEPDASSSLNIIPTIAGAMVGLITAVTGTMYIFFKKQLRRFLLKHGFKKLANFVQKDIEGDVRQMEVKMEELERFLAKQKLPRLKDVTPELTASEVNINNDVLGTGGYGAVYKGEHGGNAVAVKAMFGSGDSKMKIPQSASNMMRREAMIMCSLNHPNILRVIGIVPARGWIVMELCARGSLSELLRDPEQAVDARMSARIAAEAATGIAYLHMRDVDIVHGDMKADNCLLADDLSVRICDFGMSEVKNRSKTMTAASTGSGSTAITVAWSAPELFRAKPKSYASDVYALGLTLWEIYERAIPFSGMPEAAIVNQVLSGERPEIGEKLPKAVERLVKSCWSEDPKARPTSGKVAYILTDLSTSLSSGLGEKFIAAAVGKEIASEMKKASGVINIGSIAVEVGKDVANAVKEDMTGSLASDVHLKIDDELK